MAIRVLSLGAGVQSTALLLMSIRGELPRIDHAIFADTGWEPRAVYDHLAWLEGEAKAAGIPVHRVSKGNLRQDVLDWRKSREKHVRRARMPLFILNPDGSPGMAHRQCTQVYKVEPIELWMRREVMGLAKGQRAPREHVIDKWMGITWDEPHRLRRSEQPWERYVYPFCNMPEPMLAKRWTRQDCILWLEQNYPDRVVPRSACVGCPFHSNAEWRRIKENPEEWADAVEFDRLIREYDALDGRCYLHAARVPLDQVDLRTEEERGQLSLWQEECQGMCGV